MKDGLFLEWLANRLVNIYGEREGTDFVLKLRSIARALPKDQCTPNTAMPEPEDRS